MENYKCSRVSYKSRRISTSEVKEDRYFPPFKFWIIPRIHYVLWMYLNEMWLAYRIEDALSNDAKVISVRHCFRGQTQGQIKVDK